MKKILLIFFLACLFICAASIAAMATGHTVTVIGTTNVSCFGMCNGASTASISGGVGPFNYSWNSGQTSASATNLCAGSYIITVTDQNDLSTATAGVTITEPPMVRVTAAGGNICSGSCTTLTASGTGGTGPISYSWNPGSLSGASVSVCPTNTTTYTITGTDANGCIGSTRVVVTVNPAPTISIPGAAICEGTATTLSASGASTYSWSPATGLNNNAGSTVTANPITTTTYTVVGTNAFACTGSSTVIVLVNPAPILTSYGGNACPGDSINLLASGAMTYTWAPASSLSSNTGTMVVARPAITTTYTITGTSANGCTSTTWVTATVHPAPVAAFTTSPTSVTASNPTVYFTDQSFGGTIVMWKWTFGDPNNSSSTLQNPVFTYPYAVGSFDVLLVVTNQFGCIDSTSNTCFVTGIAEHTAANSIIKNFPNPFSDNTTFIIQSKNSNEIYSFELMDVLGKQVRSIKEITTKEFQLFRNGLPNGIYFYKLYNAETPVGIGKLVIK